MITKDRARDNKGIETLDEVINIFSEKDSKSKSPGFFWSQLSYDVHRELLYKIADELELPNPRFIASKDLEKHKYEFLKGNPLNGLYSYYKNGFPRQKGVHILINVCNVLEIPEVSLEEWISFIGKNNIFSWKNIPAYARRGILLRACEELDISHSLFLRNDDFSHKFKFLNERTLTGFYNYYKNKYQDIRGSTIINMCRDLDIDISEDDWINYITSPDIAVFWDLVPHEIMRKVLYEAANYLGYSNPRMMSMEDLKVEIPYIKNTSLYSFASRFFGLNRGGVSNIDYISDVYGIPSLSFDEWIRLISYQKNFKWDNVPLYYIGNILEMKAEELGKSNPRLLKHEDLATATSFLNNKTLSSLLSPFAKKAAKAGLDSISYICGITGIAPLTHDEWFKLLKDKDTKIPWETMDMGIKKIIVEKAAKELKIISPRLMGYKDFCHTRFDFLGSKTLGGLYYHYSSRMLDDSSPVVQYICDDLDIDELDADEWINFIANSNLVHWESVPIKIQREIVMRAAIEMGVFHPRLMGTKEFDSTKIDFLKGKTLAGLYFHYSSKNKSPDIMITDYIMDALNIAQIDINPKTGRLSTLDNRDHRKYFDSKSNLRDFFDNYLKHFDLKSMCKKHLMLSNANKAGIYRKGLITILAPLNRWQYLDFLYDILKNTPRDHFGLRKPRGKGDYRLLKSDLYKLAEVDEIEEDDNIKINFARPDKVKEKHIDEVIEDLNMHREILDIKIRHFHEIDAKYLVSYSGSHIFELPISFFPGELLTCNNGFEYEVLECRDKKSEDAYIVELKALDNITEGLAASVTVFARDSNSNILYDFLDRVIEAIEMGVLPPLLSTVLGLEKERSIGRDDLEYLSDESYYNKDLLSNPAQKQAIPLINYMDGKNNTLTIVQGPPGTGKTTLIKEIALQHYYEGKNVLVLAKTNIAVDNVLDKLIEDKVRALRSGNNIELKSDLPYVYSVSTSNPSFMSRLGNKNKIMLGTPLGFYLDKNIEPELFDILIIDEASQMDIPETLFSMQFANKCVIIGDHMQIPPFPIQNEVLKEYDPNLDLYTREELQKSLFENLIMDRDRFNNIFLDINYRTRDPLMISFMSDLIYDGRLSTNLDSDYYKLPPNQRKKAYPSSPIEIMDTALMVGPEDRMETEVDSTYFNQKEIDITLDKVKKLLNEGEKLENICIITPYKAHAERLRECFAQDQGYFKETLLPIGDFIEQNIYTIDSFQGREEDNVIINWVRSNYISPRATTRTGFLRDYRRTNVALSRARKRLILIGDFETLTKSDNMKVQYIFSKIKNTETEERIII